MSTPTLRLRRPAAICVGVAALLFTPLLAPASETRAEEHTKKLFNLPEDHAEQSLKAFAAQAGVEMLFGSQVAKGVRTNAVKGKFTLREAIEKLLAGTPLVVSRNEKTGAIKILRSPDPNGQRAAQTL
jgi:iron complex outermembrane receptor protein